MRRRSIGVWIAAAVLTAALLWALYLARGALLLIYISIILAIGLEPVVRRITDQTFAPVLSGRFPRWLAILIVYVVLIGLLSLIGLLIIPPLIDQAQQLWVKIPAFIDKMQAFLIKHGLLSHPLTWKEAVARAPGSPGEAFGTAAAAMTKAAQGVFGFVTVLILTFYLLLEGESLFSGFIRLFPSDVRERAGELSRKVSTKVSSWLTGQLILASVIGTSSAAGLYLLGVPYFYVLALISAVGEMVPVIGPILAAVPAVLASLSVSPKTAIFVVIFFIVQQQIENHLLVPRIMSRQVGVSSVTVIVALLIGAAIHGIVGAIIAVPTAAILQVLIREFIEQRDQSTIRDRHEQTAG